MTRFDRLRQIHNFLLDLPHSKFHMPRWFAQDHTKSSCGSAGCFGGWTATVFHKEGWRINSECVCYLKSRNGCYSVAQFYFIPIELAFWLCLNMKVYFRNQTLPCYSDEYNRNFEHITPDIVAKRVRRVIELLGGSLTDHDKVKSVENSSIDLDIGITQNA